MGELNVPASLAMHRHRAPVPRNELKADRGVALRSRCTWPSETATYRIIEEFGQPLASNRDESKLSTRRDVAP